MDLEPKFKIYLTLEEIEAEIGKIESFFSRVPDDLKAWTADRLIYEIVNQGSFNHYEALGIFTEAMSRYRNVSVEVLHEELEKEEYENTVSSARKYICIKDFGEEIIVGMEVQIGLVGEDRRYSGGKKYYLFNGEDDFTDICQGVLDEHFSLLDEEL